MAALYGAADATHARSAESLDLIVLGAGSGGYACALRAAELGLSVGLVEKDKIGGTCLHRGCIPTKAMLHAAEVADSVRNGSQFGIHAAIDKVDLAGVVSYGDSVVDRVYKGLYGLVSSRGISVISGAGRLALHDGRPAVAVDGEMYEAPNLALATGSYTRSLPGLDVDGVKILTSEHALRLDRLPASAIVLGGGVIGVEFASAWRSFGVQVTVVEALPRLVSGEDQSISAALERAFRKRKINVITDVAMSAGQPTDSGVGVELANGRLLEAEIMLVAVGRGPQTADLGYQEAGVDLEDGFVTVTERLETSIPGVYALGDVVGGLQLAHRGFAHGIFVAEEIAHRSGALEQAPVPIADTEIPRVTYCDPEIASVGLTESQARAHFGDVETLTYDLAGNGKSQILKTRGFVKLVRRPKGPVVGVHMIGARVSELAGEAQLITNWEAFPEDVAGLIHAHPTQSEALGEAHLALAGKPLHTHG
ncbi:MAG TPA: dihydrolipoyl dehydrogenase [Propionibacteriaceae bacterium]|nr:dihydrolipoyl dehydrogenase [Propionibacteriaceae bacterium]